MWIETGTGSYLNTDHVIEMWIETVFRDYEKVTQIKVNTSCNEGLVVFECADESNANFVFSELRQVLAVQVGRFSYSYYHI